MPVMPRVVGAGAAIAIMLLWSQFSQSQSCPATCQDTCNEPSNTADGYYIAGPTDFCKYPTTGCGATNQYAWNRCCRQDVTPILINTEANGFRLTDVSGGVPFFITPGATVRYQLSWTARNSDDAWLVLDRDNNGEINNLSELFGNVTPQPTPPPDKSRNGFLALAVYDDPDQGGNLDQIIDGKDRIFPRLRLWQDLNHNGISESSELHSLQVFGLRAIGLRYLESNRFDKYGNHFRLRAPIYWDPADRRPSRQSWAWDVYLQAEAIISGLPTSDRH